MIPFADHFLLGFFVLHTQAHSLVCTHIVY